MLVPLTNAPRDYAWGSTTLIADLQGRCPSGAPEAEVWFGDHPACPARVPDGRGLDEWLRARGERPLTYLLKLLAAASPLSIQAHPSRAQAQRGYAKEEAAGIARDAPERTYRDDNHKPELIVALSDTFTALAGLRDVPATLGLLGVLGDAGEPVAARLRAADAAAALRDTIAWLLSGDADAEVRAVIAAAATADSDRFDAELRLIRRLSTVYPADPGVVVALLMNLVVLRRGEGVFVPAGVLHAYVDGLGVEVMAASDNVLRGGLTPKHIDVAELLSVVDTSPAAVPLLLPEAATGRYPTDAPDFSLVRAEPGAAEPAEVDVRGPAIAVAVAGAVEFEGAHSGERATLSPGRAVLVTADEGSVRVSGAGTAFIASGGVATAV